MVLELAHTSDWEIGQSTLDGHLEHQQHPLKYYLDSLFRENR